MIGLRGNSQKPLNALVRDKLPLVLNKSKI